MTNRTLPPVLRDLVHEADNSRPGSKPPITFTVFANDCGLRNYGYAVVDVTAQRTSEGDWRVDFVPVEHGINRTVIDNVKDPEVLHEQQTAYLRWLARIVNADPTKPVVFAAERYMMRRGSGSLTVELVGFMLGTASMLMSRLQRVSGESNIDYAGGVPVVLFPSSTWKNAFARRYASDTLEAVYKTVKTKWKEGIALTDHQVDAYLQAVHVAHQILGFKDYAYLNRMFVHDLVATAPSDQADVRASKKPRTPAQARRIKKRQAQKRAAARQAKAKPT